MPFLFAFCVSCSLRALRGINSFTQRPQNYKCKNRKRSNYFLTAKTQSTQSFSSSKPNFSYIPLTYYILLFTAYCILLTLLPKTLQNPTPSVLHPQLPSKTIIIIQNDFGLKSSLLMMLALFPVALMTNRPLFSAI